jgi:hypothetical protein
MIAPPLVEEINEFDPFKTEGCEAPLHRHIGAGLGEHQLCGPYIGLVGILADDLSVLALVADVN